MAKSIEKFKKTGSVSDASRSGRLMEEKDEDTSTQMPEAIASSPTEKNPTSLGENLNQSKISHARANKRKPYKA